MNRDDEDDILRSIDSRLQALEEKDKVRSQTERELLMMFHSIKGFLTVMTWFQSISVWIAKMSVAGGILWFLFKLSVTEVFKREGGG